MNDISLHFDNEYLTLLNQLKSQIRNRQIKAALAVNREIIDLYWHIGKEIVEKQKNVKWGSKLLEQLSNDLRSEFKEMGGFSVSNLKRMRNFAREYPDLQISPQVVAQLPWGHISLLLEKFKTPTVREWYAQKAIENGWSRSILLMQIESSLFERQALKEKNTSFSKTLPAEQSDLAESILKDPYCFDFLTIGEDAKEREIERALIEHIRKFLLELGQGFAFIGSQVPVDVDGEEFFIDLLFYHVKLKSYVVIELKAGTFKPEHTGKLSFYLTAVDEQMCDRSDNKTIGILLCKKKNKIVAEYALRGISQPIGISEYQLTRSIPENMQTKLPSIDEIEAELNNENKI